MHRDICSAFFDNDTLLKESMGLRCSSNTLIEPDVIPGAEIHWDCREIGAEKIADKER